MIIVDVITVAIMKLMNVNNLHVSINKVVIAVFDFDTYHLHYCHYNHD